MSESQHNSRSQSSMMRVPAPTGIKRPGADIQSQPETKRQTLVERAAEYNGKRSVAGIPTSAAHLTSGLKPTSIVSLATKQQSSKVTKAASSLASPTRATNATTRPVTSNGRFAQSVTSGTAGPHSFKQSLGAARRKPATFRPRSATTMDRYGLDDAGEDLPTGPKQQQNVLDVDERLRGVESQFSTMKCVFDQSIAERSSLEELVEISKARASDLQRQRDQMEEKYALAQSELETLRSEVQSATLSAEGERRQHTYKIEDLARQHLRELDDLRRQFQNDQDMIQRGHQEALNTMERNYKAEQDEQKSRSSQEIRELNTKLGSEQQGLHRELQKKDEELRQSRTAIAEAQSELDCERSLKMALQKRISEATTLNVELEERVRMLQAQVDFLKSDCRQQSDQFASMEARMQDALKTAEEARQKLIKEEMERRILFNKYQELKGNIRVMCRVRPAMEGVESEEAKIGFPDARTSSTQIDVIGPEEKSSLGAISRKTMPFEFDRVFAPAVQNAEVFDEISQLVQSALDGYNVCIFCYGQTGSGKTYTMSSADGMIPRATHMIYDNIKRLEEKSWSYTMEGSFVEVYNEELNDLLGGVSSSPGAAKDQDSKKKLEIRHDDVRKTTTVVGCKSVQLDSEEEVETMLHLAQSNRSVAATKANERSSRSHSIFILKLVGHNTATGERCEGTLNLVDLAGSERLKHSGAEGDRKKETQNINKSLACLGDVIEALGRGAPHIPYRNSKLTHLLQYSLGGNSKTLMFVMVSPLETHLKETLTSLRFATKVHNTHIGTAKSTKKIEKP
ncbi:kar3 protein [Ophiostoma piceae UAMH 11346]|uniref:Kinesin-like protein n=1 Tax=Ophiostoma piceae (strain UAMH 11346) TaxID=1262450 RepID=S3BRX6_OPHP1|nr:kar3 protein [Ophiostoma piceae UAMH 11346]